MQLPEVSFVKAYTLYRLNRTEEALAVVDSKGAGEEHRLHPRHRRCVKPIIF